MTPLINKASTSSIIPFLIRSCSLCVIRFRIISRGYFIPITNDVSILFFVLFISYPLVAQTVKPLTNYSIDELLMDDKAHHIVLEGCISLYSAVTELINIKYPELGNQFYEMANTIYPYGIISLSKINNISYMEAEKIFFENVDILTDKYIDEMNKNGKINGSYFKGSFLANDLSFCYDVTRYLQLAIMESLGE